jgi:adenosylmethionine-8-amino-7-oxononanoate aminotransferase
VREIDRAIARQLKKIAHSTLLGLTHAPAIELAERLVGIAPRGLARVFYSDSGAEAVEAGLKIAFKYWQLKGKPRKRRFAAFAGAYHGDTIGAVSVGDPDPFNVVFEPLLFGAYRLRAPYPYRCRPGETLKECAAHCLEEAERLLRRRADEIAAVVVEPRVQGAAGMLIQPLGFVRQLREMTRRYGVLLIADEVATGFGRTGRMFACKHDGVTPDILALAKGITGGYLPLAATLATEEVFREFTGPYERTFFHGHTYTANPLACAAALASLDLFRKRRVIERMPPLVERFERRLKEFYRLDHVGDVRSMGLMAGIELVKDAETRRPYARRERMGRKVVLEARRRGVIIRPLGDVVVLMPPLSIDEPGLEELLRATYDAIEVVTGGRR